MRTQGDDAAEILALLGVRPVWARESRRVTGIEVIALEALGRPRIDVTVRISGFFRDAFPHLVRLLDDAVSLVAALEEPAEQNFVAAHAREDAAALAGALDAQPAWRQATTRIFGSKPGAYGAGLAQLLDTRDWRGEGDLAEVYEAWGGYAYGRGLDGERARDAHRTCFGRIDVAVKNVDSREHDILDSGDYYEYHGGMVATVRAIRGVEPAAVLGDSSDPSRVVTRSLAQETRRVFRARVANPRWIASMIRHGYKGAAELAATVDYLFGYDATTGVAEDWMYEDVARKYLLDADVGAFMTRSNPWAARAIAERLLEAAERGPVVGAHGRQPRRDPRPLPRARGRAGGGLGVTTPGYPFSAIVGQAALREALLVNAVAPEVGGVLVRGERGTAKSTAVRALAPLLPLGARGGGAGVLLRARRPRAGRPGRRGAAIEPRPAPLVELPVGATIDRLVGALDLGRALAGERAFEAGLLARAHRGVLYVDEVNLLPDHLVDVLLDAAAMGVCHVERDAVSVRHDARFLLVGTMNAEEGELRPQLLDRFGLGVEVSAPAEPAERAEIVRRRLAYEADPVAFAARFAAADADVAASIVAARERLAAVRLPERELDRIVRACAQIGVDGMRGDVVTARTARVLAALDGVDEVDAEHVRRAAHLALVHRRRRDPLAGGDAADPGDIDRALDDAAPATSPPPPDEPPPPPRNGEAASAGAGRAGRQPRRAARSAATRRRRATASTRRCPRPPLTLAPLPRARRRHRTRQRSTAARRRPARPTSRSSRRCATGSRPATPPRGARTSAPRRDEALLCLVVDASGSMAARRRMARVKGALLELLREAYARRERVAIIAFGDARAHVVHEPGAPLEQAAAAIARAAHGRSHPAGGGPRRGERAHPPRARARSRPPRARRRAHRRPRARRRGRRAPRRGSAAAPMPCTSSTPSRARSGSGWRARSPWPPAAASCTLGRAA